jgi:hypothetical protein
MNLSQCAWDTGTSALLAGLHSMYFAAAAAWAVEVTESGLQFSFLAHTELDWSVTKSKLY